MGTVTLMSTQNGAPEVKQASEPIFKNNQNLALSFGDMVALSGDFVAGATKMDEVICEGLDMNGKYDRFKIGFERLMDLSDKVGKYDDGYPAVQQWLARQVKNVKAELGNDAESVKVKAWWSKQDPLLIAQFPKVVSQLKQNFDHFGKCAQDAYRAGHSLAQMSAFMAGSQLRVYKEKPEKAPKGVNILELANEKLKKAYMMDAMALHFLSDQFSAGHVRTDRLQLHRFCKAADWVGQGGTAANHMHDEDNLNGLYTTSREEEWNAKQSKQPIKFWWSFGDSMFHHPANKENRERTVRALQTSKDEIWKAFLKGTKNTDYMPEFSAMDQLPNDEIAREKLADEYYLYNTCPMFSFDREGSQMTYREVDKLRTALGQKCTTAPIWDTWEKTSQRFETRPDQCKGPFKPEDNVCSFKTVTAGTAASCPTSPPKLVYSKEHFAYFAKAKKGSEKMAAQAGGAGNFVNGQVFRAVNRLRGK